MKLLLLVLLTRVEDYSPVMTKKFLIAITMKEGVQVHESLFV